MAWRQMNNYTVVPQKNTISPSAPRRAAAPLVTEIRLHLLNTAHEGFSAHLRGVIAAHRPKGLPISKSYSRQAMAICISNRCKVAIDIEERRLRATETIIFFKSKFRTFGICDDELEGTDLEWFYRTWTAMESYLKLKGRGFRASKDFSLNLDSGTISVRGKIAAYLKFVHLDNFCACLCCETALADADLRISRFGWREA
jgi:phosphopantetheinyl transferase